MASKEVLESLNTLNKNTILNVMAVAGFLGANEITNAQMLNPTILRVDTNNGDSLAMKLRADGYVEAVADMKTRNKMLLVRIS